MDSWPTVELKASGVVRYPIDLCWTVTRDFGQIGRVWDGMVMAGEARRVRSYMMDNAPGTTVGGMRVLEVGDMVLVQRLDAVDDEDHKLKYHAVDHPSNRWDPPGSFVNDAWTISMKSVTLGNFTHIDMSGKFYTEPENVAVMSAFIAQMCDGVITGVQSYLSKAETAGLLRPRQSRIVGWQQPFSETLINHQVPYQQPNRMQQYVDQQRARSSSANQPSPYSSGGMSHPRGHEHTQTTASSDMKQQSPYQQIPYYGPGMLGGGMNQNMQQGHQSMPASAGHATQPSMQGMQPNMQSVQQRMAPGVHGMLPQNTTSPSHSTGSLPQTSGAPGHAIEAQHPNSAASPGLHTISLGQSPPLDAPVYNSAPAAFGNSPPASLQTGPDVPGSSRPSRHQLAAADASPLQTSQPASGNNTTNHHAPTRHKLFSMQSPFSNSAPLSEPDTSHNSSSLHIASRQRSSSLDLPRSNLGPGHKAEVLQAKETDPQPRARDGASGQAQAYPNGVHQPLSPSRSNESPGAKSPPNYPATHAQSHMDRMASLALPTPDSFTDGLGMRLESPHLSDLDSHAQSRADSVGWHQEPPPDGARTSRRHSAFNSQGMYISSPNSLSNSHGSTQMLPAAVGMHSGSPTAHVHDRHAPGYPIGAHVGTPPSSLTSPLMHSHGSCATNLSSPDQQGFPSHAAHGSGHSGGHMYGPSSSTGLSPAALGTLGRQRSAPLEGHHPGGSRSPTAGTPVLAQTLPNGIPTPHNHLHRGGPQEVSKFSQAAGWIQLEKAGQLHPRPAGSYQISAYPADACGTSPQQLPQQLSEDVMRRVHWAPNPLQALSHTAMANAWALQQ